MTVGVSNGIPAEGLWTAWTNVVDAGADNTGATDVTPVFQSLIASTSKPAWATITVPAGTYMFSNFITMNLNSSNSYFRFKGAGPTNTILIGTNGILNADMLQFPAFASAWTVSADISRGDTNLTIDVGQDASAQVGQTVVISCLNVQRTDVDILNTSNLDPRGLEERHILVAVTDATNLTVWPPITIDYPASATPQVAYNSSPGTSRFVGWEEIGFWGTNFLDGNGTFLGSGALGQGFRVYNAQNWWFTNCHFRYMGVGQMTLLSWVNGQISHCAFWGRFAGSGAYCIDLQDGYFNLIENNYAYFQSPFVEKNRTAGNVISYAYTTNMAGDGALLFYGNPINNHSGHSHHDLIEGVNGIMYQYDGYHGSESHTTLFRNVFQAYDPLRTSSGNTLGRAVDVCRWGQFFNIVDNVLGNSNETYAAYTRTNVYSAADKIIYRFGYPYPGNLNNTGVTPNTDWRYPGAANFGGTITSATGTGTAVEGDMSAIANGSTLIFQSQLDTNLYYPYGTKFTAATAGTSTGITFSASVSWTNGDVIYVIGANSYPTLTLAYTNDFIITGNYDYFNNAQVNPVSSNTTSLYLADGGSSAPGWWVDENGDALPWPASDPTDGSWGQWPMQQQIEESPLPVPAAVSRPRGLRGLRLKLK